MDNQFKLGPWLVNPSLCTIENEHGSRTVEPKAMALLVTLAEANGELVTRSELFEAIWKDQVVTDYALNTLMANLRKNLNTGDEETQYIETRTKLGYRLTPQIEWLKPISDKSITHPLIKFRVLIYVVLVLLTTLFILNGNGFFQPSVSNQNSALKNGEQQYRYFTKIIDTVTQTNTMKNGEPYCIDRIYENVVNVTYKNQKWTLSSNLYDVTLKHNGNSLVGVKEKYQVNFWGTIGTVSAEVDIFFKYVDDYTARAKWKVLDTDNQVICEGTSIVSGQRI